MSISGITNLNQYATTQMVKTPATGQASMASPTTANTVSNAQSNKPAANDIAKRIASIPNVEQYEDLIQRFISGESELENPSSMKPLTEDQIALRGLMREYHKTDTRTLSQVQASMQQANKNFLNYWMSTGNKGPIPGHVTSADGSFQIFNSKAQKDEFMKKNTMNFLENVMSVIKAGKFNDISVNSKGLDLKI